MLSVAVQRDGRAVFAVSGMSTRPQCTAIQNRLARLAAENLSGQSELLPRKAGKSLAYKQMTGSATATELEQLARQGTVKRRVQYYENFARNAELHPLLVGSEHLFSGGIVNLVMPAPDVIVRDPNALFYSRHCSEPKALEAAFHNSGGASAMTTIWWAGIRDGNDHLRPFQYRDPASTSEQLPLAVPCDFCATNQPRIMQYLANLIVEPRLRRAYSM